MSKSLFFIPNPLFDDPKRERFASENFLATIDFIFSKSKFLSDSSFLVC